MVGVSRGVEQVAVDGLDNDDDLWIDEADERETSTIDGMLTAVYPEVGTLWIDGNWRVTTFAAFWSPGLAAIPTTGCWDSR